MSTVKVSQFQTIQGKQNRTIPTSPCPSSEREVNTEDPQIIETKKKNTKTLCYILIAIGIAALLAIILTLVIVFGKKNQNKNINEDDEPNIPQQEDEQVLKPIFTFNNKVGDLKRITVSQTSYETMTTNGQITKFLVHRNTTYDIYFKSENKSDEKTKNFYTNKYIAVMNIVKECVSTKEENCEPQTYIDLSETQNKTNLRVLPEVNDLKDIPIPICLIEFTDNDAITSISCPESISENKKYEMTLDFYFFRPPAIERPVMNNPLITVTIENIPIENGNLTRERNSGICDTKNAYKTHCTTDMNTTTDSNNNVMSYDEIAFSNFSTDENNSYVKTKKTYLKDITNQTKEFNKEIYEKHLNDVLEKLDPYLKKDELFSESNFSNLHSIIKGNKTEEKSSKKRKLKEDFKGLNPYIKTESLFFNEINGVKIDVKFENDIGIGTSSVRVGSNLLFDDYKKELASYSKQSPMNTLLEKLIILSKAGNNLANELNDEIIGKLDNITKDISLTISSLNDMIVYNDLVDIFDSSLSVEQISRIPSAIIKHSQSLYDSINKKLVDTTEMTYYKNSLNKNIQSFLSESHSLIYELFEKLKEFGNKLGSPKGQLTEIATYYLKNNDSYSSKVSIAENILKNYYKNEAELILNEVNAILKSFEENITNSVQKEIGIIEKTKIKLEKKNLTIDSSSEDVIEKVILNLNESINKISEIISTYKSKTKSGLELKANGYFISENEIQSTQKQINDTLNEININVQKFDHDDLIDSIFDEIMSNFRVNFTQIKNSVNTKRDSNFFPDEDVLKSITFTQSEKDELSQKLKSSRSNVENEIIKENDEYKNKIKSKINEFVTNKNGSLYELIKKVDVLFSEKKLKNLLELYENLFNHSFELITNQINNNKQLSNGYFEYLEHVLSDNASIFYHIDPYYRYKMGQTVIVYTDRPNHYTYVTKLQESIKQKHLTDAYKTKYNIYSANLDSYNIYLNKQMYFDLSYEYKNIIIKLKSLFQTVKNNKFSDKYGDLTELTFVNDNIRIIDGLYTRLDKYFSEILYNNNYLLKFNEFKQNQTQYLEDTKETLVQKNKLLTDNYTIINDKINDFCITYLQLVTHTCTNGVVKSLNDNNCICTTLLANSSNHNQLVTPSIKSENINFEKLQNEFEDFYSSLNQNINEYNNILTTLKNEIASLETNSINKEGKLTSLNDINENIKTFLNQKYGDNLVKDSYDFYKNTTEKKLADFLNFINEKWKESFNILDSEIKKNKKKFKNNIEGFGSMAYIYIGRLNDTIIDYTNSIIKQQKNEFNYTISYYYNYLYTLVNKTYQYIIGKIPTNRDGFNNILNYRKNQVIEKYNEIIQIIKNSENNAINENNQINLLDVSITDFFKVNNIIENSNINIQTELGTIASDIVTDSASINKDPTQYSISALLYLENSENGKIIEELSDSINSIDFINLNLEKFKKLIDNNMIFDQENLLSSVDPLISKSNLEILNEYETMRDGYYDQLENEIKRYFTKESLVEKIDSVYKNGINELDDNSRNKILLCVNETLEVFVKHIKDESDRLQTTFSYNSNYETINQTIRNYKEEIFSKIKNEIVDLFENLNKRMYDKIYTNYLEEGLNGYVNGIKLATSNNTIFKERKVFENSYKLGDDIDNIAEDLSNQYKNIGKEEIENIIRSNYYKTLNLEDIQQLINDKIESAFTSYLFPALKDYAIYDINDTSYYSYDLSNDIKNNISLVIKENLLKIKDIMNTTKGENYDLDLDYSGEWEIPDFSEIGKLVKNIGEEFDIYIVNKENDEKESFNINFRNNINTNFNEMLNNFIPSFGKKFFERIYEYNLNNRIDDLFNNYKYSFTQTFFYYIFILNLQNQNNYPILKDLKQKLLKVNDVNLIVEQNEDLILKKLDNEINNFIDETRDYLVNKYISKMQQVENSLNFSDLSVEIKSLIIENLEYSRRSIENQYKNILQSYLKNPLIEKCELYLKDKINELIILYKDNQRSVSSQIQEFAVVDSEEILNEINEKINSTLEQVDKYNNHFNQFNISESIKEFLLFYGNNSIKPLFEEIIIFINNATKDIINKNINEHSDKYEKKLDFKSFNDKMNESLFFLNELYINFINDKISIYDSKNYANKLDDEKDRITSRRRRILENSNTEADIKEDYSERVADKPLDDTFSNLLDTIDNVQNYVDSLSEFNNYDKLIKKYKNNINIAVEKSKKLIKMYNFESDITDNLNDKLSYLNDISLDYYNKIDDSYFIIRDHIKNSIKKINDEIKKCANVTYDTFANNYNNILNNETYTPINDTYSHDEDELDPIKYQSNQSNSSNETYSDDVEELDPIKNPSNQSNSSNETYSDDINYPSTSQNGKFIYEAGITDFRYNSDFEFDVQYEETKNIRKPKIYGRVTNRNIPKKMNFNIYREIGKCGKIGQKIEIEFNNANYSTSLNFDTKSTNIKLTTTTKFDKYSYSTVPFEVENSEEMKCFYVAGVKNCQLVPCKKEKEDTSEKRLNFVEAKESIKDEILLY